MSRKSNYKKSHLILTGLLVVQIIGLQILKKYPNVVETYYSLGFYPLVSGLARYLFGWIPFSVGDVFYTGLTLLAFRWIIINFKKRKRKPMGLILEITSTISVVYFMFHLLWGLNYYRLPLHQSLGIGNEYTYEQLVTTTKTFITKSNELHKSLAPNDSTIAPVPYTQREFFDLTSGGFHNLQKEFPNLQYQPRSIKKSLWSTLLSYMGYSGYLNPFSGEAQVNGRIHFYKFPVVACHEEAHQIGFAAENEANFIAILATLKNDDPYLQYAGAIFALRYLLNDVAGQDREEFEKLRAAVAPGILLSYKESDQFWDDFDNPFDKVFLAFFDGFLKASNQSKGIRSYNYVVALLANWDFGQMD